MKVIKTRLRKEQIKEIEQSGSTVYAFLQEAVREKLEKQKQENLILDFQKKLLEEHQQMSLTILKEVLSANQKIIEQNQNSRDEIATMLNKLARALELKK